MSAVGRTPPSGPRIGSLCSGYGGLDLAVTAVLGGQLVWCADSDPHAAAILAARYPGVPNLGDITRIDWHTVPRVDLLTAGFPCQDISTAGRGAGIQKGTRSGIWENITDAVRVLRPRLLFVETSPPSASAASTASSVTWPRSGTTRNGHAYAHPPSEHPTAATDCSCSPTTPPAEPARLLPTARARDHKGPGYGNDLPAVIAVLPTPTAHTYGTQGNRTRRPGLDQMARAQLLPTPQAADATISGTATPAQRRAQGHQVNLAHHTQHPPLNGSLLPTPRASDSTKGSPHQHGSRGDTTLPAEAIHIAAAPGSRRRASVRHWGVYAQAVSRWEHIVGRPAPDPSELGRTGRPRLAPAFVEWLMGLPPRLGHRTAHITVCATSCAREWGCSSTGY